MPLSRRVVLGAILVLLLLLMVAVLRRAKPDTSRSSPGQARSAARSLARGGAPKRRPARRAEPSVPDKPPARRPAARITPRHWPAHWIKQPWRSLLKRRRRAVWRGLKWMESFIQKRWDPEQLGVDAVYIFLEVAQTSTEKQLRRYAIVRARRLALKMKRHFLRPRALADAGDLLDAFDLLAEARHLGLSMPRLLTAARHRYRRIASAKALYGVSLVAPWTLSMDDFFDLLINAYIMEKLDIAYPGTFPITFGLRDLMPHVMTRRYRRFPTRRRTKADKKRFKKAEDDAFLATHVAYVLNYYGRLRLYPRDLPSLYRYLQSSFHAILKQKDTELVGEYIDVYRSARWDETNHLQARIGTMFLLDTQASDGSWGPWKKEKNPYDAIHFTWCAVLGLRERFFLKHTRYERRLRQILLRAGANQAHPRPGP